LEPRAPVVDNPPHRERGPRAPVVRDPRRWRGTSPCGDLGGGSGAPCGWPGSGAPT
jgi:hypothetical protein